MNMSTAGYVAAFVLTLLCLAAIIYPLYGRRLSLGEAARRQRKQDELLTSYERAVTAIRDLDEDFNTGKLHREDYEPERQRWVSRGVDLLRQLEEMGVLAKSQNGHSAPAQPQLVDDDDIENAVAQYRKQLQEKMS